MAEGGVAMNQIAQYIGNDNVETTEEARYSDRQKPVSAAWGVARISDAAIISVPRPRKSLCAALGSTK